MSKAYFRIYTDGSANNLSPEGEGGLAYIIFDGCTHTIRKYSEGILHTTNNRAEMMAIIKALKTLPDDCEVDIKTDSSYAILSFLRKGIRRDTKNKDLIELYRKEAKGKSIRFVKVKGHSGNTYNEQCDKLAKMAMEKIRTTHNIPLYTTKNTPKTNRNKR